MTVKKHAIILGSGSDIGKGIAERLRLDGWAVSGHRHNEPLTAGVGWDLIVCCYGVLAPIGKFWEVSQNEWDGAFNVNLLLPARQVAALYPYRKPSASVCFFSGAGANGPAPTYSAYCVGKIALTKMVECMDAESEDCKFFILGPGMMRTKIQEQTLAAGPERAANYERVRNFMGPCPRWPGCGCGTQSGPHACEWKPGKGTDPDDVYACLMACVAAPKEAVGGRNIYVPLDDWSRLGELAADPDAFKLRRAKDGGLRRE